MLWGLLKSKGVDPESASLNAVAEGILQLDAVSSSHAHNAYAALLLLPPFAHLRFVPLLSQCKKRWHVTKIKYSDFWDARGLLELLAREPLKWNRAAEVRERLLLCLRILHLMRSVDLVHLSRKLAVNGDKKVFKKK